MQQEELEKEIQRIQKLIPRLFYRLIPHYNPHLITKAVSPYAQAARLQDTILGSGKPPPAQAVVVNSLVSLLMPLRAPLLVDMDVAVHEQLNEEIGERDFVRRDFESAIYGPTVLFKYAEWSENRDRMLQVSPTLLATAPEVFELGDTVIVRVNTKGFLTREATCVCRTHEGSQEYDKKSVFIRGEFMTRVRCVAHYVDAINDIVDIWKKPVEEKKEPVAAPVSAPIAKPAKKQVEEVFG